jgi:hypothetical protein
MYQALDITIILQGHISGAFNESESFRDETLRVRLCVSVHMLRGSAFDAVPC